jgi:hypothetical protein
VPLTCGLSREPGTKAMCSGPGGVEPMPWRYENDFILGGTHQADFKSRQVRIKYNAHLFEDNLLRINIITAFSDVLLITRL